MPFPWEKYTINLPVVYETEKIVFYVSEEQSLLISIAKDFSPDDEYRTNMQSCLDNCQKFVIKNIIFESTKFRGTSPENQKWVTDYFTPKLVELGILNVALVYPSDIFGKYTLVTMARGSGDRGLSINFFDDIDKAYHWIMAQQDVE